MNPLRLRTIPLLLIALLAGCAGRPPPPDWQMNAHSASDRAVDAYLTGRTRIETLEFNKARTEVARTGDPATIARIELLRCATRVASLVQEECTAFNAIAQDATPAERAYADYLAGRLSDADSSLLPPQHQAVRRDGATALNAMAEPLSRLVAAGVLFKTGHADASTMVLASDTASAQGWSRPLLAWLQVRIQHAEQAGAARDGDEVARLKRRIALVLQTPPRP
jgi:hypothetical protein